MLKTLNLGRRACFELCKTNISKRFLFSETYQCKEAWKERLNTDLLKNVNLVTMLNDVESRYQSENVISAIDVDIVANVVQDQQYVSDVLQVLEKLRTTPDTINTLDSTHHAVIRYLLDLKAYDTLIDVLHSRLKYGIFPSHYCYNLLIDTFLKMEDYGRAAKIAVLPMLQEDSENEITNVLCTYACVKYLDVPDSWKQVEEPPPENDEEIKVRVNFVRNPFYDDHFDIVNPQHLVGKTLIFYANHVDGILQRSLFLRGMLLYQKYKELLSLVQSWKITELGENTKLLFEEDISFLNKTMALIPEQEKELILENISQQLRLLNKKQLSKDTLQKILHDQLVAKIGEQSATDMYEQRQKYVDWISIRQQKLQEQKEEVEKERTIGAIQKIKDELQEKKRLLTFFDKEEKIEIVIDEKEKQIRKAVEKVHNMPRSARKLKKLVASDMYVAPELLQKPE